MMKDRRKSKRKHLYEFFKAIEKNSGDLFGKLSDISSEGIRLLHNAVIEVGTRLNIKVLLPRELKMLELDMQVECIWHEKEPVREYKTSGFKIINISTEQQSLIRNIF
ncbi:MAG: hypothetical protein ACD_79C01157G0001 [uncultured bacterium]|nr:MAG: hypothetical protein ACD_79C01157G0001 [uncultured bacterium]